jgi:hypothetical protein
MGEDGRLLVRRRAEGNLLYQDYKTALILVDINADFPTTSYKYKMLLPPIPVRRRYSATGSQTLCKQICYGHPCKSRYFSRRVPSV